MSYTVAVTLSPVSDDDAEAWEKLDEWREEEGPVPQVMHDLITRLTERYPCICDLPDEEVDEGVWTDGPLRDNAGHKVTVLGIVTSHVEEVLPFLIQSADSLGLTVFDHLSGRIFRATGTPRGRRPEWE